MLSAYHSKVRQSILLKIRESHFCLFWVMDFIITSPCFGKVKVCFDNPSLTNLVTFNVCMKSVNELYVFLTEVILCFETVLAVPH